MLTFSFFNGYGQEKYWIYFKDKDSYKSFENPETLLSKNALERRKVQGILIDYYDIPINNGYVKHLSALGCKIVNTSKWLNAVSIITDFSVEELKQQCSFIEKVTPVKSYISSIEKPLQDQPTSFNVESTFLKTSSIIDYGQASTQNKMLGIDCLHDNGYTGKNVVIAILDGGFIDADTMMVFDSARVQNRIIGAYDFAVNDSFPYKFDKHGTAVLSVIAANIPGQLVGMAPHSKFLLARTLTDTFDTHTDEDNWIRAMEWADSMGADVINTSLGYSNYFGGGDTNYTYSNMDGNTTIITKGADIAAKKGIIMIAAAGNEGDKTWKYIAAPCDGDSVLCVGAVNSIKQHSSFSSYGPSYDGRVKPEVMAMGQGVRLVWPSTPGITSMNGTSFSTPLIAGLAACLKQKHPGSTNMEIINAIIKSADRYSYPNTAYGYGIPNACTADLLLTTIPEASTAIYSDAFQIYPNPAKNQITLKFHSLKPEPFEIIIYNAFGEKVYRLSGKDLKEEYNIDLSNYTSGMYYIKISVSSTVFTRKLALTK